MEYDIEYDTINREQLSLNKGLDCRHACEGGTKPASAICQFPLPLVNPPPGTQSYLASLMYLRPAIEVLHFLLYKQVSAHVINEADFTRQQDGALVIRSHPLSRIENIFSQRSGC